MSTRVAVLWKQLSGYMRACLQALTAAGADVFLVHQAPAREMPYDDDVLRLGFDGFHWTGVAPAGRVRAEMEAFRPDAVLVSSWDVGAYRRASRRLRGRAVRILCMDNQWLATPKQRIGALGSRILIAPTYDLAFLPADRQAVFAARLGFRYEQVLWGLYTCDHGAFSSVGASSGSDRRAFLFVGRLTAEKGVDVLAEAYRRYRPHMADPWPLLVCGTGPISPDMQDIEGVVLLGFVQPGELPAIFERASCLVLPSRFEQWGVVIHEAVSARMAVICSTACGASTRLVLDGYNGAIVPPGDPESLAIAMRRISSADPNDLATMGSRSFDLSRLFTPERWARDVLSAISGFRRTDRSRGIPGEQDPAMHIRGKRARPNDLPT